jgi:hypothetical protein
VPLFRAEILGGAILPRQYRWSVQLVVHMATTRLRLRQLLQPTRPPHERVVMALLQSLTGSVDPTTNTSFVG